MLFFIHLFLKLCWWSCVENPLFSRLNTITAKWRCSGYIACYGCFPLLGDLFHVFNGQMNKCTDNIENNAHLTPFRDNNEAFDMCSNKPLSLGIPTNGLTTQARSTNSPPSVICVVCTQVIPCHLQGSKPKWYTLDFVGKYCHSNKSGKHLCNCQNGIWLSMYFRRS